MVSESKFVLNPKGRFWPEVKARNSDGTEAESPSLTETEAVVVVGVVIPGGLMR